MNNSQNGGKKGKKGNENQKLILFQPVPLMWTEAKPPKRKASSDLDKWDKAKPSLSVSSSSPPTVPAAKKQTEKTGYGEGKSSAKDARKRAKEKAKNMHARIFKNKKDKLAVSPIPSPSSSLSESTSNPKNKNGAAVTSTTAQKGGGRAPLSFNMVPFQSANNNNSKGPKKDSLSSSCHCLGSSSSKQKHDKAPTAKKNTYNNNSMDSAIFSESRSSSSGGTAATQRPAFSQQSCSTGPQQHHHQQQQQPFHQQRRRRRSLDLAELTCSGGNGSMSSVSYDSVLSFGMDSFSFFQEPVTISQTPASFGGTLNDTTTHTSSTVHGGGAPKMPVRGGSLAPEIIFEEGGLAPKMPVRGESVGPKHASFNFSIVSSLSSSMSSSMSSGNNSVPIEGGLAPKMPVRGGSICPEQQTKTSTTLAPKMPARGGSICPEQTTKPSTTLAPKMPVRGGSICPERPSEKSETLAPKMPRRGSSKADFGVGHDSVSSISYDTLFEDLIKENRGVLQDYDRRVQPSPRIDSGLRKPLRRGSFGCSFASIAESSISDASFYSFVSGNSFEDFKIERVPRSKSYSAGYVQRQQQHHDPTSLSPRKPCRRLSNHRENV